MNLDYLGDALDHWKGSLFQYLQTEGILRDFAVDPMVTDRKKWTEDDFVLFARLLHIKRRQIIRHEAPLTARGHYLAEIAHKGDLFLDPDTGIATKGASPIAKYVKPREVAALLHSAGGRVLAVYQHVRAQKTCARVDGCVAAIAKEIDAAGWCSYESSTVAMLFLCSDATRAQEVWSALHRLLGRHGERRVRFGKWEARLTSRCSGRARSARR
jgi:hypothetical protein